jgi:hypothetical protein
MNLLTRPTLTATPIAVALMLAMTVGASAQVASLIGPEETAEPEAVSETILDFEDRQEAILAYAQCMRDNDIDMDDPVIGEGGRGRIFGGGPGGPGAIDRQSEEFQAAQQVCSPILEASRPEVDPEAEQERLEEQLALSECIRQHGYPEYPDPTIGSDGRLERAAGRDLQDLGIDRRSEAFLEVMVTCREEIGLEQLGPGGRLGLGRGGD